MKANEVLSILDQFRNSDYQKILIDGNWGIGKTKYVTDFIQNHSNACYVSLFGKKDVNSIIQELYFYILDNAPKGKVKKHFSIIKEKLSTLDFSFMGVSLTIPLIENVYKNLNKELSSKGDFIIAFDDLERKHSDLDIKEVFGIVDSLSKIENIKVVIIAAQNQFEEADLKTFLNYNEKAIDRTYTIEEYADEAPMKILSEPVWEVLQGIVAELDFKNLRTFQKTNLFIGEVVNILGESSFSERFTKEDLYRMCFAIVFFIIEHNGEPLLLKRDIDETSSLLKLYYADSDEGKINYLCNHVLHNSLKNDLCKWLLQPLKIWFEKGDYSKTKIFEIIDAINDYKEKPHNFYSSEQEILNIIDYAKEYLRNIDGTESINNILFVLNNAFEWCDAFSIDFHFSEDEIIQLLNMNIVDYIDISKSLEENLIDPWIMHLESEKSKSFINAVNGAIKDEYYNKLMNQIENSFYHKTFEYFCLRQLESTIIQYSEMEFIKDNLLERFKINDYYFPVPSGRITESHWNWCLKIQKIIIAIERRWKVNNYVDDFRSFVQQLEEQIPEDKMLHFRLNELLKK